MLTSKLDVKFRGLLAVNNFDWAFDNLLSKYTWYFLQVGNLKMISVYLIKKHHNLFISEK